MNDVAYRLNTALPVRKEGTCVVNNGSRLNLDVNASGSVYMRSKEITMANETANTGIVDRMDDYKYYTS